MLINHFLKNKATTTILFIFIFLSTLLVASGTNMITELINSMNSLFTKSEAPHFVQMHSGEVDLVEIDQFATSNHFVQDHQVMEMILVDRINIDFGNTQPSELMSMMDHYFVKQNKAFDFLLNGESKVIQLSPGEVAVPLYFMQKEQLKLGDNINITSKDFEKELTIVDVVRDVQMNPAIIHSKRFVVNEADLNELKVHLGQIEYLIEFQLKDVKRLNQFRNAYQTANLPQKGPAIDYPLFKMLNAITDGMIVAIITFVSFLLTIIAFICIRFIILAAIEEDYREIGVMKAIGIGLHDMKKIYVRKYVVLAAVASLAGYVASLFLNGFFTQNLVLYMGTAPKNAFLKIIPLFAVMLVFFIIVSFSMLVVRRLNKISAVEALSSGAMGAMKKSKFQLLLNKNAFVNLHIFLGLKDLVSRRKVYRLLFFVFLICVFIVIVPVNLLTTIQSPNFIKYMGVERSDLRIDLQQSQDASTQFSEIITSLTNDPNVEKFSSSITSQFKIINGEGIEESIVVESGDFSVFPLDYLKGVAPIQENEIALSYTNSNELGKDVGDMLTFMINGQEREVVISGIYQDVTNGGRTAKALLPPNEDHVFSYKVSVDVSSKRSIKEQVTVYAKEFHPAKVTDINGYLDETFGTTIAQLKVFTIFAIVIAVFLIILITSLFLKMILAKDQAQMAIMKSIGFANHHLQLQYVTRILTVLILGIIFGMILSHTIGQWIVSGLLSFIGAAEITFVVDPVKAYLLCPLILILTVVISTLLSNVTIKKASIINMDGS